VFQSVGESSVQNNQDHLRFRRRAIPTASESQPKNKFGLILTLATAVILLPVMIYGLMHPTQVTSTVKQIAHHVSLPVKEMRVAVIAVRATMPPSPTPAPTPTSHVTKAHTSTLTAHEAHLKRLRERTLAAAREKKVASTGQTSDVAGLQTSSGTPVADHSALNSQSSSNTETTVGTEVTPAPTAATVAAAAAPDADATPLYAPDVVVDARFTRQVQPEYPAIAKAQGVTGTAVVLATIGPDGKVVSAHIDQSTGNTMLDNAALDAAKESGFQPPIIDGKPATETYRLVYNFEL
jgi:TonB family protein